MLDGFQIVAALFLVMALGYALAAKGWIDAEVAAFLSKTIVYLGVPASAVSNLLTHVDRTMLAEAPLALGVVFLAVALFLGLSFLLARVLRIREGRRGIFAVMVSCANTIFIGLPVCQALFGDAAASYVLLYDLSNSVLFWTLGVYLVGRDSGAAHPFFSVRTMKKLLSPGFLGLCAGIALVLLGVQLPLFLEKTCKYFGGLCTPLALLYVGYSLHRIGLKNLRIGREVLCVVLGRAVLTPLCLLGIVRLVGLPADMSQVFVAVAAMPAMNNAPIVAGEYGSDVEFSSQCLSVTMIVNLLLLPVWKLALGALW